MPNEKTKEKYITEAVEDYLKTIYALCQEGGDEDKGASTQKIAARLGVSAPGVTKMLHHLAKHDLIEHTPYQGTSLTPQGEKFALELIRHHRLLELYLNKSLGFGWEQVHAEAEKLEHHISEGFEASIERLLDFPEFDPHGDPIPTRDGQMPKYITATLAAQADGAALIVRRVTDENPDLLCYLKERRLLPGTPVRIAEREPFGGALVVDVDGSRERVSPEAAAHVFVEIVNEQEIM